MKLQLDQLDTVFKAFADPTRLRLLCLLRGGGEVCVCDLVATLQLPQAKVSRHLAYLRRAGLVETRREGQWIHYRLSRAQDAVHAKMLQCLRCCLDEVPELQADQERFNHNTCAEATDCC